jgi:lipopolysaccharide transport system ATP-binding protein
VSHNLGAISRLCQRCILLEQGRIIDYGPTDKVVQTYTSSSLVQRAELIQAAVPGKPASLLRIALEGPEGNVRSEVGYNESFRFVLEYEVSRAVSGVSVGLMIFTSAGACAFTSADFDEHPELLANRAPGTYRTEVEIPAQWLNVGRYTVSVSLANAMSGEGYEIMEAIVFSVIDTGTPGSVNGINRPGILQPVLDWKTSLTS